MKRKEPKQILEGFSWVYMFFAIIGVVFAILVVTIPAISEAFKSAIADVDNPIIVVETSIIVSSLIDLWYFYLIRRYTSEKSNGTLLIVLLAIGFVGGLISIFMAKSTVTISFIINAVVLYYLYASKKQ